MTNYADIKKLIINEALSCDSLFAVSVIDLSNYEIVYSNDSMEEIMADVNAKNCWESIHGQDAPCAWCKAPALLRDQEKNAYSIYEHFNEVANKWYQIQDKVVTLEDGKNMLISFAIDISMQKESQSQLINMHVKLAQQTQELKQAQEKLQDQANRDPLTNMYNRRYFNDISEKTMALSKRNKTPFSVLMIDIDKFKNINDAYGHNAGDEVIKLLASRLCELIRESDTSARFGGEEFAVMLPNTAQANAARLAQKIRIDIEGLSYVDKNETIKFTVSVGVAEFDFEKDSLLNDVLDKADKALYDAKNSGRNRVSVFNEKI